MKTMRYTWIVLLALLFTASSCEAIGDIFQAGMTVGIVVVIIVVALILWLVSRFRK